MTEGGIWVIVIALLVLIAVLQLVSLGVGLTIRAKQETPE